MLQSKVAESAHLVHAWQRSGLAVFEPSLADVDCGCCGDGRAWRRRRSSSCDTAVTALSKWQRTKTNERQDAACNDPGDQTHELCPAPTLAANTSPTPATPTLEAGHSGGWQLISNRLAQPVALQLGQCECPSRSAVVAALDAALLEADACECMPTISEGQSCPSVTSSVHSAPLPQWALAPRSLEASTPALPRLAHRATHSSGGGGQHGAAGARAAWTSPSRLLLSRGARPSRSDDGFSYADADLSTIPPWSIAAVHASQRQLLPIADTRERCASEGTNALRGVAVHPNIKLAKVERLSLKTAKGKDLSVNTRAAIASTVAVIEDLRRRYPIAGVERGDSRATWRGSAKRASACFPTRAASRCRACQSADER